MGLKAKANTFSAGETILAAEFNTNYDEIYAEFNGLIDNDNVKNSAAIPDSKLAQIATAGKVAGSAITGLTSLPSAAGNLPSANLPLNFVLSATDTPTELTIASDTITVTQSFHTVDTEADASTDYLYTINGGVEGMILMLRPAHTDRTVQGRESGNIISTGNVDMSSTNRDFFLLIYDGSNWLELAHIAAGN